RVVAAQERIALDLRQQDTVGHELQLGARLAAILEPDLVTDGTSERAVEFTGNASGNAGGGDAPRLGDADLPGATRALGQRLALTELKRDLRELCGLTRTRCARDDHDLIGR